MPSPASARRCCCSGPTADAPRRRRDPRRRPDVRLVRRRRPDVRLRRVVRRPADPRPAGTADQGRPRHLRHADRAARGRRLRAVLRRDGRAPGAPRGSLEPQVADRLRRLALERRDRGQRVRVEFRGAAAGADRRRRRRGHARTGRQLDDRRLLPPRSRRACARRLFDRGLSRRRRRAARGRPGRARGRERAAPAARRPRHVQHLAARVPAGRAARRAGRGADDDGARAAPDRARDRRRRRGGSVDPAARRRQRHDRGRRGDAARPGRVPPRQPPSAARPRRRLRRARYRGDGLAGLGAGDAAPLVRHPDQRGRVRLRRAAGLARHGRPVPRRLVGAARGRARPCRRGDPRVDARDPVALAAGDRGAADAVDRDHRGAARPRGIAARRAAGPGGDGAATGRAEPAAWPGAVELHAGGRAARLPDRPDLRAAARDLGLRLGPGTRPRPRAALRGADPGRDAGARDRPAALWRPDGRRRQGQPPAGADCVMQKRLATKARLVKRRIAGRVQAGDVVVAVGGGEVQRHRAGEVGRELGAGSGIGRFGARDVVFVGRIQEGRQAAEGGDVAAGLGQRIVGIGAGDDEADRAEALLPIEFALRRCRPAASAVCWCGPAEIRGAHTAAVRAAPGRAPRPRSRSCCSRASVCGDWIVARIIAAFFGSAPSFCTASASWRATVCSGTSALRGAYALRRDVDVLRAGAHLRTEHAHRRGQAAQRGVQVVGGFQHHGIAAGSLGEGQCRIGIAFDPLAEGDAAGEVDDGGLGMLHQQLADRLFHACRGHRHQVRIEAGRREHLAEHPHRDRHRQDGGRMRLDDHRIAGRQAGHHRRPGVPGRKAGAGEADRDAPRHQPVGLVERDGRCAELALPARVRRHGAHRLLRVYQRLDGPVQRVDAGAGIGHVEALSRGVHDGVGQFEQVVGEQPLDHLHQHAQALFDAGAGPRVDGRLCSVEQAVHVGLRIADAQRLLGIGRDFCAQRADAARLVQFKRPAELRAERGRARLGRRRAAAMPVGRLREQRGIAALEAGAPRLAQRRLVAFMEARRHRIPIAHAQPSASATRRHHSRCTPPLA